MYYDIQINIKTKGYGRKLTTLDANVYDQTTNELFFDGLSYQNY